MAHRFLDIIEIETERLSNLISDTLLLSEIESKQDTNREPCDVNAVIAEVVELLQPKIKEHVRLIFQPDPTVKFYNCNRDRIKQLLINLIDNGLKATEFGAGKKEIGQFVPELSCKVITGNAAERPPLCEQESLPYSHQVPTALPAIRHRRCNQQLKWQRLLREVQLRSFVFPPFFRDREEGLL